VDVPWDARAEAERAVAVAEVAVARAVERLVGDGLSVTSVVKLTRLGQPTVRRLRQIRPRSNLCGGELGPR